MDQDLILPEVAVLLKVAEKTVYSMAQTGPTIAFMVRGQSRLIHDDTDQWIDEQNAVVKGNVGKDTPNV
jgi:hypothetical protein